MILIGCEESQVITQSFRWCGLDARSCDLEPTRGEPEYHYQCDVMDIIPTRRWDMIILHPDCTALALCGNSTYGTGMPKHDERLSAIEWTVGLWELAKRHSDRVCLENPMSVIFKHLDGGTTQYIQPYEYGHMEKKKTGLHLRGLMPLVPSHYVYDAMMELPKRKRERIHYMSPGPNRKRDRSVTFAGISRAIAVQWGRTLLQELQQ